jgi:DNA invertase Pin-like site-specific DNA recombinase
MHTVQQHNSPPSNINNMTIKDRMDKAISALKLGDCTTITTTAKEYGIDRSTLLRRYNEKTVSREEAISIYYKQLTTT